ncbi:Uncharacterised protein [Lelliottia amnigena]|jgi:hypothetical protein|uniref:hypothetical protein n=1 Tax=Lelliottia TaxID=1330545 RepID=UPI0007440D86|nr:MULTISPECIES: hypothetical protein [Lelliottia]ATG04002.1 hypothetical protein CO697_21635 [Lelliottia amnigena]MCG7779376.1 hypothetical protein [Lelliottia amnigena]PEG65260.1 hypothetical protein CRH15_08645 [Lelliottia amnigena]QXA20384.1 hypothetical protein I6L74_13130 [Lelliottia amnigena]USR59167.1 hypothetical protein NFJ01_12790 [Lelliottia amnigena]
MKIWPFALLFISITIHAGSNFGVWSTTCDDDGFSINIEEKPSPLVVNDNQIVINSHSKEVDNNKINILYDSVTDLGRGGMNFDWKSVSSTMPIAVLSVNNNNGKLLWKGFYDNKKSKYYWINDPDFVQSYAENGIIKLHKCEK